MDKYCFAFDTKPLDAPLFKPVDWFTARYQLISPLPLA